jgi:hypothetical protein
MSKERFKELGTAPLLADYSDEHAPCPRRTLRGK